MLEHLSIIINEIVINAVGIGNAIYLDCGCGGIGSVTNENVVFNQRELRMENFRVIESCGMLIGKKKTN